MGKIILDSAIFVICFKNSKDSAFFIYFAESRTKSQNLACLLYLSF
ncbi:hypothetical protein [Helicobacter sp. 23-1045]